MMVIFAIITIFSPWVWLVAKNPKMLVLDPTNLYRASQPARISEINKLRGEASDAGVGLLGRIVVNKITWNAREAIARILMYFDPHYLFLEGDINITRSTGKTGPVFLTLVPLALWGFLHKTHKQKLLFMALILGMAAGAIVFEPIYFMPAGLGVFVIFNWLAAEGVVRARWSTIYLVVVGFEVARFAHDFWLHYPYRIGL